VSTEPSPDRAPRENGGVTLARASWSITAAVLFVFGVVLLIEGYLGYAIVTLVISVAAAINLL
jgi:hypothetical protein